MRRAAALLIALGLSSCATLSEEQCRSADWQRIGQVDGVEGRLPGRLEQHRKACEGIGVVPDAATWERGRQAGLRLYCTPERAYEEGAEGRSLAPICPAADAPRLRIANRRGLAYHDALQDLREIESDLDDISRTLARMDRDDPGRGVLMAARARLLGDLLSTRLDVLAARP